MKDYIKNKSCFSIIKIFLVLISISPCTIAQQQKIDSLLNIIQNDKFDDSALTVYFQKIAVEYKNIDVDSSYKYLQKALKLSKLLDNEYLYCFTLLLTGDFYNRNKMLDSMKYYYNHSLYLANKNDFRDIQGMIFNGYGVYHMNLSNYDTALVFMHQASKISESIGEIDLLNRIYNNIGVIHYHLENFDKALYYYEKTLKYRENAKDAPDVAIIYNNMGIIYYYKNDINKSIDYFKKSLEIYKKQGNLRQMALPLYNIAELYEIQQKYNLALKYLWEVYSIENKLDDLQGKANTLILIGKIQSELGMNTEAINNQLEGTKMLKELGAKKDLSEAYLILSETYESINDFKMSLKYYKNFTEINDTILNEEKLKLLTEVEAKYETKQKEQQIKLQDAKIAEQTAKVKKKNFQIIGFFIISFLLLLLVFAIYKSYRNKKRANEILSNQKEEIESQRDEIEAQRNMVQEQKERIEAQQKEIKDSIRYAQRIQSAIMPPDDYLNKILDEHFIINIPRDIVGGDFYWVNRKGHKLYMAVADCTGHGVPGGFMSMMGVSFLNEILNEPRSLHTNQILDMLRKYVIESMHQTGESGGMKDGMDISLCILDLSKNTLEFSGAFSALYLFINNDFLEVKGDKMPIGFYRSKADAPFTKHTIELKENNMIYMFTDGYIDQFGGENGDKFKTDNFKNLLQVIYTKSMIYQKEILYDNHMLWKGTYDQIDDILIFGLRIKNRNQV
ncbi:MAG: tetratricopeptide repeat protein [Bacteroidales bacterium]|nr:tetratricopeptide repeat protein [Bacteroidales bacterium]